MLKPLVLVLGPTASGKSALALEIAERFTGEIVNCDSLQLYRHFDVGTAKPSPEERRRVPHHLFDILNPEDTFTAGDYARTARPALRAIAGRGAVPVVVGGTGFYARALLEGLFAGPRRDVDIRARLSACETRRPGFLHRALRRFDPDAAARIHANDRNKLTRAVEVCLTARRPLSQLFEQGRDPLTGFEALKLIINPPRHELTHKLDRRCLQMLEDGLIQEIANLLISGISPECKPFEAIGYKEMLAFLKGELTLREALEWMRRDTRRYAKRQATWFRRESGAHLLHGFGTDSEVRGSAVNMVAKMMQDVG